MKKFFLVLTLISMAIWGYTQKPVLAPSGVKVGAVILDATELQRIDGLTSNVQEQLNNKPNIGDGVDPFTYVYSKSFFEATALTDAATITWNGTTSKFATVTLGGNRTLSITNPIAGIEYVLRVAQDGTGGRLLTWPANTIWPGGTAPTLTSIALGIDVVRLTYDGSNFLGKADVNLNSDLKNGLVSYYTFDGATGTADSKGTNTATFSGGLLVNQTGKLGQCVTFDGVDDFASLGTSADFNFVTGFTISFWVKNPLQTTSTRFLINKTGPAAVPYSIKASTSSVRLFFEGTYFSPTTMDGFATAAYTADTWTHNVFTYDGIAVKHYKNNVLVANSPVTGTMAYSTYALLLGKREAGNFFQGSLDELGFWNRALTPLEISRVYNSGTGSTLTAW